MLESESCVFKGRLRANPTTGWPAGKAQKCKTKSYGLVMPLTVVLAAVVLPTIGHPRRMFSMCSVK
jgi:hypothetical protein